MNVLRILEQLGFDISLDLTIFQFHNAEDGSPYEVWKVQNAKTTCVLKKAKGHELEIYATFFNEEISGAPRFLGSTTFGGDDYFLMEYVEGEDLRLCNRDKLTAALDALIDVQSHYWENHEFDRVAVSYEAGLAKCKGRRDYLRDAELEQAYDAFLELYELLPRTLCHDDLLPFNVLVSEGKATLIDWEYAGVLPYPTSLARLIAHGEERNGAFFYMTEDDKLFAVSYYFEHLVKKKGISYADYRKALDNFLLYEYCEWVMLGNKYADADMERYRDYFDKAKTHVRRMKLAGTE